MSAAEKELSKAEQSPELPSEPAALVSTTLKVWPWRSRCFALIPFLLLLIIAKDKKSHDLNFWFLNRSKNLQGLWVPSCAPSLVFPVRWVTYSSEGQRIFPRETGQPYITVWMFFSKAAHMPPSHFTPIPALKPLMQQCWPRWNASLEVKFQWRRCPSSDVKLLLNLSILWACNVLPRRTSWTHFSLSNLRLN